MEVIVVGSGLAGLAAARRAQQNGAQVTIVDKANEQPGSNSRISGGAYHAAMLDPTSDPDKIYASIMHHTENTADPELSRTYAKTVGMTLKWLQAEGQQFVRGGPAEFQRFVFAPPRASYPALYFPGRAGDAAVDLLKSRFLECGGRFLAGHKASRLLFASGAIQGIEAENSDGASITLKANAVVLCDGGFQANKEMVRKYICATPELLFLRAVQTGTGDGIRMAQELGAATVSMDKIYGHPIARDAMHNPELWPFPMFDHLFVDGMLVDADGHRFMDESWGGVTAVNEMTRRGDARGFWVICDRQAWEGPAAEGVVPPNPHLLNAGGKILSADTIEALAEKLGIDPGGLAESVTAYNQAAATNSGGAISPPRSGPIRPLNPPFMGVATIPSVTVTMGGLRIDAQARVLDEAANPIPGLYAAGSTAGGIEGGPHAGYVGGVTQAMVFGLIAGQSITKQNNKITVSTETQATQAAAAAMAPATVKSASSRPEYPTVSFLVQNGKQLATALSFAAPLLGLTAWLTGSSIWALIGGLLAAPVIWFAISSYAELARMVYFLLVPGANKRSAGR